MDPVSTTASIFTLIEVANKVGRKLINLRHAPEDLLALNNEVADLQLLIEGLRELDQGLTALQTSSIIAQFYRQLKKTQNILLNLDKFIAYELTKINNDNRQPAVDRSVWLRSERKVNWFKAQVRDCKGDLNMTISMMNSSISLKSFHIVQSISELCLLSNQSSAQLIRQLERVVTRNLKQEAQNSPTARVEIDNAAVNKMIEPLTHARNPLDGPSCRGTVLGKTSAFHVSRRGQCTSPCFCSCHKRQQYRSPALLEGILGSLFIGYLGMPVWYRKCNDKNCKSKTPNAASITYRFPSWFCHRAVRMGMIFAPCNGPELLLRFPRLRPHDSKWFEFARKGEVEPMQKMLANGEASVHDVEHETGRTALHVESFLFLVHHGSDLEAEDNRHFPPAADIWSLANRGYKEHEAEQVEMEFCRIFKASLHEIMGKTQLQTAYLENDPSFWNLLDSAKKLEVEEMDVTGKDLLQTVVLHGDIDLARKLLDWGINPNRQNNIGNTSLHVACLCWGDNSDMINLLLERGASYMTDDCQRNTPFDSAIRNRNVPAIKCLSKWSSEALGSLGHSSVFRTQTFVGLARYSNIEIIKFFWDRDILVANIEEMLGGIIVGWTAVDVIEYRRLHNTEWSSWSRYSPDTNPSKIYYAFKALIRKIFKRSTSKDATFKWNGKHWIAVAVEEGDEESISEDEFCFEEDLDDEEEYAVHTTDEEWSEENSEREDDDDKEENLIHSGDDGSEIEEEKWEDAPES